MPAQLWLCRRCHDDSVQRPGSLKSRRHNSPECDHCINATQTAWQAMLLHALYIGLHAALLLSAARRNVTVAYKIPRVEKNNAIKIVTIDGRVIIFHYLLRQSQPPCSQAHTWHTQAIGLVYTAKTWKWKQHHRSPWDSLLLWKFLPPCLSTPTQTAVLLLFIIWVERQSINQSIKTHFYSARDPSSHNFGHPTKGWGFREGHPDCFLDGHVYSVKGRGA